MLSAEIEMAIADKRVVCFYYEGYYREVEPHVLGVSRGATGFLGFQVGGESRSGRIPNWRRFDLAKIDCLDVSRASFHGPRPTPSGRHSSWDQIIAVVA